MKVHYGCADTVHCRNPRALLSTLSILELLFYCVLIFIGTADGDGYRDVNVMPTHGSGYDLVYHRSIIQRRISVKSASIDQPEAAMGRCGR